MTIADEKGPGKAIFRGLGAHITRLTGRVSGDMAIIALLILASTGGFGLGVIAGKESGGGKDRVAIEEPKTQVAAVAPPVVPQESMAAPAGATPTAGAYVASKTGTKYYLPWCGTAKRIKEENKVWFATKEEAEAKGYEPGKNCKGL